MILYTTILQFLQSIIVMVKELIWKKVSGRMF